MDPITRTEIEMWFFKNNKIYKPYQDISRKIGLKSIKLEMTKEKLQWTSQKYKGL